LKSKEGKGTRRAERKKGMKMKMKMKRKEGRSMPQKFSEKKWRWLRI